MKRFTAGLLNRTKSQDDSAPGLDSPEASAARGVRLFCESASESQSGEEVLHLPVIVEAAESSPQAAASAAYQIRKFLSKENNNRSHVQYNAIMLIRILTDNPGPTFTRNLDPKFVDTVRNLLKNGRDPSVQQILRETLDALEANKSYDEGLQPLLSMWRATKGSKASISPNPRAPQNFRVPAFNPNAPPMPPSQRASNQQYFTRSQLPPPGELASRIEEARNTAKILLQLIQSTPPEEISNNELVKEFAERCQGAQRSMQEYINCDNPPPDDDTLQTLIEINEQLSLAASRHQRAMLSGRRVVGAQSGAQNGTQSPNLIDVGGNSNNGYGSVPQPPPRNEYPQYPTQQQPYNAFDSAPQQTYNAFTQSQRQPDLSNANPYSHEQPTPQQQTYNAFTNTTHSLSPVSPQSSHEEDFAPPPGPPPSMTARLQSRTSPPPAPAPRHPEPASDPFADPDHDAVAPPPGPPPGKEHMAELSHPLEPSHYGLDDTRAGTRSPQSPSRPALGAYHQGATPSYVGRQASAVNGLTMHGAVELDQDSRVERLGGWDEGRRGDATGAVHEVYRY